MAYIFLKCLQPALWMIRLFTRQARTDSVSVGIDAGENGWKIREYGELYLSALEFLGEPSSVKKLVISPDEGYLRQVLRFVREEQPDFYCFSSRTSQSSGLTRFVEIVTLSVVFYLRGISPITLLADFHNRRFRMEAAMISAFRGIVVTMVSSKTVSKLFPHSRIIGPHVMPFSKKSAIEIRDASDQIQPDGSNGVVFTGSLYSPREEKLEELKKDLGELNIPFQILTRRPGGVRVSEEEYWGRMSRAKIVVTTADQTLVKSGGDFLDIPHMVYRYLEVLISRRLLVAPAFSGIGRFFVAGEHFVEFSDSASTAKRIEEMLVGNPSRCEQIVQQGHERAMALVESGAFWTGINNGLGSDCLV
ncbi:MAG: glycosyltransferase [Verrucomicrobiota bacterium]